MFSVPYSDGLVRHGYESLETRRIRAELFLIYKLVHRLIDIEYNDYFTMNDRISR